MATSVAYTALLSVREETVLYLASLLNAERTRRGTRRERRALGCFKQAVLVLRRFLDNTRMTQLAADNTIGGFGFDHARYPLPSLAELDEAAGDHPLHLFHTSGHHVLVNSRVLREARIDDDIADPPGGRFDRDAEGHLTGLCLDAACGEVLPTDVDIGSHGPNFHVRAPMDALVAAVSRASAAFLAAGLTCVSES